MFINIQDPSDTRKGELRRAIRSQAALSSAGCRKTTIAAKAATGSNSPEESDKVVQKREKGKTKVIKKEPGILISPSASQPPSPPYFPPQISEWSTQTDPFRSFPSVDAWHASIPRLVDIYLTFFAPDVQDPIYRSSRPALRQELWPLMVSHSALFFTNLLIATTHQSFSEECPPETVAWFRHQTICSIQAALDSVTDSHTSDQLIAAISLLCGYELEFGEDASSQAHMAGLKTMVNMRGGLDDSNMPSIVRNIVLSVTHDLALYAGWDTMFEARESRARIWTKNVDLLDVPEGFMSLKQSRLVFPATLDYVAEVCSIMRRTRHRKYAILDLQSRISGYDYMEYLSVDFCPIQSSIDDAVKCQAEKHVKTALLCLLSHLQGTDSDYYYAAKESLSPGILSNTVYAEMGIWALFIICSTMPFPPTTLLGGLERLLASHLMTERLHVDGLLHRYLYPSDSLQSSVGALWEQLMHSKKVAFGQNLISRYDRTRFHPKA